MQVSVETPEKLQRRLTITIPAEQIESEIDQRLVKLSKTAQLKGFRPGKVPLEVIKKNYQQSIRYEVINDVMKNSLYEAIQQEKLSPINTPVVEPKTVLAGQPLEFVAVFEVLPEIGEVKFANVTIEKPVADLKDSDLNVVIERLRTQHANWNKVDRAAQNGDQLKIDFKGSIDGTPFAGGEAHDFAIVLGSKSMIPGFEEGLVGLKAGTEKELTINFPAEYHAKHLAGKPAQFAIKVLSVSAPELSNLDAEFIKKLGIPSGELSDLHAEIRKNLLRECHRIESAKVKSQVFKKLLELNPLDIPKSLIDEQAKNIHDSAHGHHDHNHDAEHMQEFEDAGRRQVHLGLLVHEVVDKHQLTPDKERVRAHIEELASAYEDPANVVKWYYSNANRNKLAEIEAQILEDQIVDKLLEQAKVVEKKVSYQELITPDVVTDDALVTAA